MTAPSLNGRQVPVGPVVRAHRRLRRPQRTAYEHFYRVYTVALIVVMGVLLSWAVVGEVVDAMTPAFAAAWAPAAALLLLAGVARYGIRQGPVSFTPPDCAFLLGAPIDRGALVRRRLAASAVWAALGGTLLGGLVAAGAGVAGASGPAVAVTVVNGALLLLFGGALSWHVQRSAHAERVALRAAPFVVLGAALLVLGGHGGHAVRDAVLWTARGAGRSCR